MPRCKAPKILRSEAPARTAGTATTKDEGNAADGRFSAACQITSWRISVISLISMVSLSFRVNLLSSNWLMQYGQETCQHLSPNPHRLLQPEVRESFTLRRLHPNPASPHPATETLFPRISHLNQFQTRYLFQDLSRLVIDAIVSTQVTGVMISHFLPVFLRKLKSSLLDQLE